MQLLLFYPSTRSFCRSRDRLPSGKIRDLAECCTFSASSLIYRHICFAAFGQFAVGVVSLELYPQYTRSIFESFQIKEA